MKSSKAGGGPSSKVVVNKPVRTGAPRHVVSPKGVSQIGQQLSNHVTDRVGKFNNAPESVITGKSGISVPLGNAVALNVGKGGPGAGRTNYGQAGSQCQTGPVAGSPKPAGRGILSEYGPDSGAVRGRR